MGLPATIFESYLAWLVAMDGLGVAPQPGRVITWNLDKRYLGDLAEAGVPVVPTRVCGTVPKWTPPSRRPG